MLDGFAVAISAICLVHCLALPVLLVVFPLLVGTVISHETFHQVLLWVIVPTSVAAILVARRTHPDNRVLLLVGTGMLILIISAFWAHDLGDPRIEIALNIVGGLTLAGGHIRNVRVCRHGHAH
jgi:hypothetical protein